VRVAADTRELVAPISGRRCVFYAVEIEDQGALFDESNAVPFVVEDPSGRALVEPEGSMVAVTEHTGWLRSPLSDAQHQLFVRNRRVPANVWYRERIIPVDGWLEIIGAGTREPDPDAAPGSYRGDPPTRVVLQSSSRRRLLISDGT
jgi:hypothetical protein